MLEIRFLTSRDAVLLESAADGLFDLAVDRELIAEFLADGRHHLCAAIDDGVVVGFISAVHYVHPDKPAQLWINEVSVAPSHRRQGAAKAMLQEILLLGRRLNCTEAWVLTDESNTAANRLYHALKGEPTSGIVMYTFPLP